MKVLYNTNTQEIKAYPRSDDAEVVGLDPIYVVLTRVEETPPNLAPGERLEALQAVDLDAKTVTISWRVLPAQLGWSNAQDFMEAFTLQEKAAVALSADATVASLRFTLSTWFDRVLLADLRVQAGLAQLVTVGILTTERKDAVVATAHAV